MWAEERLYKKRFKTLPILIFLVQAVPHEQLIWTKKMYQKSEISNRKISFSKEKPKTDLMEMHLKLPTQWNRENHIYFFYSEFIESVKNTDFQ